jgi:hypothetical protein
MGIDSPLSTCVGTQSPKYLEMAQGHISLSNTSDLAGGAGSMGRVVAAGRGADVGSKARGAVLVDA